MKHKIRLLKHYRKLLTFRNTLSPFFSSDNVKYHILIFSFLGSLIENCSHSWSNDNIQQGKAQQPVTELTDLVDQKKCHQTAEAIGCYRNSLTITMSRSFSEMSLRCKIWIVIKYKEVIFLISFFLNNQSKWHFNFDNILVNNVSISVFNNFYNEINCEYLWLTAEINSFLSFIDSCLQIRRVGFKRRISLRNMHKMTLWVSSLCKLLWEQRHLPLYWNPGALWQTWET